MADSDPYYQISAIISLHNKKIHYFSGFSAQKSAWYNSAEEAHKKDGKRTYGVHKGCLAKKGTQLVKYVEVNRALDLIASTLHIMSKRKKLHAENVVDLLDEALGKTIKRKNRKLATIREVEVVEAETTLSQMESHSFWEVADSYCMDTSVSIERNKSRANAINHLRRFEKQRQKEIRFSDCNAKLLSDFQYFIEQDCGDEGGKRGGRNQIRKKNRNTICRILTCVKQLFGWSRKHYGITNYGNVSEYVIPAPHYADPITLTQEEKRTLWNTEFSDKRLEYVRDLFYFQCSIGCRVSDYFNLKYKNLVDEGGTTCIYYCPRKTSDITGIHCRIPLSLNALRIFEKYRLDDANPDTPLFCFPKYSQVYNRQLKRLFKAAGLNRKVIVYNSYNQMEVKSLHEVAISKFARSCFIDVLVGQGVTDNIISTMSGHIAGSKAFHRYHNRKKATQQNLAVALLD